jgi:hypothetical protein
MREGVSELRLPEQWLEDFDRRTAELTARQHALLRSLGVEPAPHRALPERVSETAE